MRYVGLMFALVALLVGCCSTMRVQVPCEVPPRIVTYEIDSHFYHDEIVAINRAHAVMEEAAGGSLRFLPSRKPDITYIRARTYMDFPVEQPEIVVGLQRDKYLYIAVEQLRQGRDKDEADSALLALLVHETGHYLGMYRTSEIPKHHAPQDSDSCMVPNLSGHMHCADKGLGKMDREQLCEVVGCYCR